MNVFIVEDSPKGLVCPEWHIYLFHISALRRSASSIPFLYFFWRNFRFDLDVVVNTHNVF
jgi:hypothetical protein